MNSPKFSWKTLARGCASKFLYHLFLNENKELRDKLFLSHEKNTLEHEFNQFLESYEASDDEHLDNQLSPEGRQFAYEILNGLLNSYQDIKAEIGEVIAPKWQFDSLEKMDRSIILVACHEIKMKMTPYQVAISEAINMAKSYGSNESASFINGVLDRYAKSQSA